jgi:hypothetical protein
VKISTVYVYPLVGSEHYLNLAVRFLKTYHEHPPGLEHESIIVCNGNPPDEETAFLFGSLPNVVFTHHDNSGFDCGAYQSAARNFPCDLMVFFGASTYFKREGWLKQMAESYEKHGAGLYGAMGNRGVIPIGVHPHIRTTAFWMNPEWMNAYPHRITRSDQRYGFEHGQDCLTSWVYRKRGRVMVVGWSGAYEQGLWDSIPNGYHRGDQSDLLAGDRNSEPPFYPVP